MTAIEKLKSQFVIPNSCCLCGCLESETSMNYGFVYWNETAIRVRRYTCSDLKECLGRGWSFKYSH